MHRVLLFLVACLFTTLSFGQVVYEDFESAAPSLNWNALDGSFAGIVDNPAPNAVNNSARAGSYTKSGAHAYSLLLAELPQAMDLSVNNQFSIQIYTSAPTQILLKLEGPGGAIEGIRNIAVANAWQTYTFDFSAQAANTGLTKVILFFDPGVETSADTYLFDNLVAHPAGVCAGTVVNPQIIDDFECQRNATYGQPGWEDIRAVANPDPSGVNTSTGVGEYTDGPGPWHALVIDYQNPINLSEAGYFSIKMWAPKTGILKFKLEGGASPPVERDAQVTTTGSWVEYGIDFSDMAGNSYRKLVFFVNAGVDSEPGDVYYMDDIKRTQAPAPTPLEDFEDGARLSWGALNNNAALHGSYTGPLANPNPNDINDSPNVGRYVRGSSAFSTLTAFLPEGIDLSDNPQLNLNVHAPTGGTSVTLQLQSPTQGAQSVTVEVPAVGEWVDLNFDFSNFSSITDFERVNILFDPGAATASTWYFDNLRQGESTVDPCEGVEVIPTVVDDFECQRNVAWVANADRLAVINNPDVSLGNTSLKVGEYTDALDAWSALVAQYPQPIDLSTYNQLSVRIWSPSIVPLLFKLEGGSDPVAEVFTEVTAAGQWVRYQIDFSQAAGRNHPKLAIFFNAGQTPTSEVKYYIDDIQWRRAPYTACVVDFDVEELSVTNWAYFGNAELDGPGNFLTVPNPAPSAVNNDATVGVFREAAGGQVWAGMFADLDAPIAMPAGNKTLRMKVWMDHAAPVVLKMEQGVDGAPGSGDVFAEYNLPNQWQELTWNFSNLPNGAQYNRVTLIMDIANSPSTLRTYYFDDLVVAGESCDAVNTNEPTAIEQLKIWPNPAQDWLQIEDAAGDLNHCVIFNSLGQRIETVRFAGGAVRTQLDLSGLAPGMYVLAAYNHQGVLIANARVVKQ